MRRMAYVVMADSLDWKIQVNGVDYPHYQTQSEAIGAAVAAAFAAGQLGNDAVVLIQDSEGRVQVEWTYGDQPRSPGVAWKRRQAG